MNKVATLSGLVVIEGDETLLVMEAGDSVREQARQQGFTDRHVFIMDARSDWQPVFDAAGAGSLFGDNPLLEITLPSGKPGRGGAQAILSLTKSYGHKAAQGVVVIFKLPRLDRQTQASEWYRTLREHAHAIECPSISTAQLPGWIQQRLSRQGQSVQREALEWIADHVEGNLLAAHQEILKLDLLYPQGEISTHDVQMAVMDVARYDVMALRDAVTRADSVRALRTLRGLKAEGQALPLVLWALSEDLHQLDRLQQALREGQNRAQAMRSLRIFGQRQQSLAALESRLGPTEVARLLDHAHDIDRLIKGIDVPGRLDNAWQEMARLTLRIVQTRTR